MRIAFLLPATLLLIAIAAACRRDEAPTAPGQVQTAGDGTFTIAGRPRFLVGAQILPAYITGLRPTSGYPEDRRWLYERPLDGEGLRRLGLDSLGHFTDDGWIDAIAPGIANGFLFSRAEKQGMDAMLRNAGVPVYVDFTAFPWTHGSLAGSKGRTHVPAAALNAGATTGGTNHWMPYSAVTEEGRALYAAMWRHGTQAAVARGAAPLVYELFNEPAYDDQSPAARERFAKRLAGIFATPAAMDAAWGSAYGSFAAAAAFTRANENPGLQVEWSLFMEDAFVDLCRLGRATVRAVDPTAACAVQPLGMDCYRALGKTNVNAYRLATELDIVGTGTGGGLNLGDGPAAPAAAIIDTPDFDPRVVDGFLHTRFMRAIAGRKPIYDGESYAGTGVRTADELASRLWLEAVRGIGATYLFAFERRTWDELWRDGGEAGGRRLAQRYPWDLLNPYATPPEALDGIQVFKRGMAPVEDLVVPRANRQPARIALLVSLPSERIAPAIPETTHQQIRTYANALEFSHQAWDVVLEEQLAERAAGYGCIIAAGIRSSLAGTPDALRRYVAGGGRLILGLEGLDLDAYGRPRPDGGLGPAAGPQLGPRVVPMDHAPAPPAWLPGQLRGQPWRSLQADASWSVLAETGGIPAVMERRHGAGSIAYINLRMPAYPLASLLGSLLRDWGVQRLCEVRLEPDGGLAPDIEVHRFATGAAGATAMWNWDGYPKLVSIDLPAGHVVAADVRQRRLLPVEGGRAVVALPARGPAIILSGTADEVRMRLGACTAVARNALAGEITAWRPPADAAGAGLGPRFAVAGRTFETVDLRRHANRGFVDRIAGDGLGGWTDQGAGNSLDGTPWGRRDLLGVPFEFIRFDENDDRTCIAMRSARFPAGAERVDGIAVGRHADALLFLQAAAWCGEGDDEVMRYQVRYADGGTVEVPVRVRHEISDWWGTAAVAGEARRAWSNVERRSLYAWRWANPEPGRMVESIGIVAGGGAPAGLVVAISVELAAASGARIPVAIPAWTTRPWGGAEAVAGDGVVEISPTATARAWCGADLEASVETVARPGEAWSPNGVFSVSLDGMRDAWGAAQGGHAVQVALVFLAADGTRVQGPFVALAVPGGVDAQDGTWQEATAPMSRLAMGRTGEAVCGLRVQFQGEPPLSGIRLRDACILQSGP